MSKPISFGFSSKNKPTASALPSSSNPSIPKPITLPSASQSSRKTFGGLPKTKTSALQDDSEGEDDAPPKYEELTGFSSSGAILSRPKEEKAERVIENAGNGDWRRRGKNLLPEEVKAARNGAGVVTMEKSEVSKAYGLQFAEKKEDTNGDVVMKNGDAQIQAQTPAKAMTEDERALAALLDDGSGRPRSNATIDVQANNAWQRSEADDFRADVATRPDMSTLDEYAAMPVEEFGMAMLRGMGKKRRANGEIIDLNKGAEEDKKRKERKQEGFLGIGAKPVKGLEGVELGAWGKSDMRKNNRGEGFFTPVMIEDKRTGERITEEEFERRKKESGKSTAGEEDWRARRDRNLEKSGRGKGDGESDRVNGKKRDRDERDRDSGSGSRSRRDRDRDERDEYESSRSRKDRDRSRSRDRRRKDNDDYDEDDRNRERDRKRDRDRHRDKYRDDDSRHDSSSSRRSEHRRRDRDRDYERERNRDSDRDDRRHRDR